jgi:hypothetical protein
MRGAETFDGKLRGNRQIVDRYNEARGKKKREQGGGGGIGTQPGALPKTTGGESGGAREASGHDEVKQVAMEHGPAHSHHVLRRPDGAEGGRYHSVTHHEDGFVHHADHDSLEDAHAHGGHAMEDTEHLGDMDKEDYEVAEEHAGMEDEGSGSRGSRKVGYMS